MSRDEYDLIVIGAGQGGGPLAGAFARRKKHVALVEREHVGGTCVNEGCTPTKTMIASARVAHVARHAAEFGVRTSHVETDLAKVVDRKNGIVSEFREGSEKALDRAGVELIRGTATFADEKRIHVSSPAGDREISALTVVIDTGSRPSIAPVDGLDRVPYLTSTSIMDIDAVPEHLIVLGGGYVGLEFGQMFRRFGSEVTVIQNSAQLVPHEDSDVAEEIKRLLEEDGITVLVDTDAVRCEGSQSRVKVEYRSRSSSDQESDIVEGSHVLVATGRKPNTEDLNLSIAGVETDSRGYVTVNDRLETSRPGVFAIGDVNGGPAFTHVSYDDFRILRTNLLGEGGASTAGRVIPYVVFIDPQLGRVGMTEKEAAATGKKLKVAKLPMSKVARAIEVGETHGFMKAVVDAESGQILGASVLGMEGGEIVALMQIAMMGNVHYSKLRDGIFSHPTLSESLNQLFKEIDPA